MALPPTTAAALRRSSVSFRMDAPIAPHTWWGVGGPADAIVDASRWDDLVAVQRIARDHGVPVLALGNGSNLCVSDAGVRGMVLRARGALARIEVEGTVLTLGAGARLTALVSMAARRGWPGLGCFAGIPGTVGGAVATNAGASLGETRDVLIDATVVLPGGVGLTLATDDLGMAYRTCALPDGAVIASARVALSGDAEESRRRIEEHLAHRRRTQPIDRRTCGSTFRNPPGDHAGRLIDAAGLKGLRVGGAEVSALHANFVVNRGDATATDIRRLIDAVRDAVRQVHGVELVPEVHFAGDWSGWSP